MLSFSKYLAQKHKSTKLSPGELISLLPVWLEHLQAMLLELRRKRLIAENTYDQCSKNISDWGLNLEKHVQGLTISKIDAIYQKLLYVAESDMTLSPRRMGLDYPFVPNISGVRLQAQLVMQDDQRRKVVLQQTTTQSLVGSTQGAALKKRINTKLGQIDWLEKSLEKLGKKIGDIHLNDPHAEIIWCVEHSGALLEQLKSLEQLNPLNDDFPQSQLIQTPRLEVITSSSCCSNCRLIFSALRLHLKELGIHLPIVLYADSPFNTGEIHGSVYVVLSGGSIFNTQVQCNTPGARYQLALPWGAQLDMRSLSSKEQSDWNCLTLMGGVALLDLLKVGIVPEELGRVNPITYIAPDSLIIYAAEKWLDKPRLAKPLMEAIVRLNEMLANIGMKMLTWWRVAFTEQLHWLLISELDPKYREHARKHAYVTNTNFTIGVDADSQSNGDEWCNDFYLLWSQLNNLKSGYKRVLEFFVENNHARMPFGCMVGPLSVAMIKNHFKEEKATLLWLRGEPEDDVSEIYSSTNYESKEEKEAISDDNSADSEAVQPNAQQYSALPTGKALNQLGVFATNRKMKMQKDGLSSNPIQSAP